MLIDDIKITVEAGNGGRGAVAFNSNMMSLGPVGGSGGAGGSVYIEGVSDLTALNQFRYKKEIKAKDGAPGSKQFRDGHDGGDLVLKIPVGTVLHKTLLNPLVDENSDEANLSPVLINETQEVLKVGEKILLAKGGIGGRGNFHFRSSRNTSPTQFQKGLPGEQLEVRLELKLIADIGLIGLPNAGKSSLLNELTKARSKVANYPFTTLEPNLGVYYTLILADIPGLIEGASTGKGLGIKFLRHIERTKILFHLISAESKSVVSDYKTIKKELKAHSKKLGEKPEYIFLSKSDTVTAVELKKKIAALKKINKNVLPVSIHDWESLEKVKKVLNKFL